MRPDNFVPYADWSYYADGATPASHPIGWTSGVTAHWEGPGMGHFPHDRCARKVRAIQRFHRITRGWADIAYNAVVCPHGTVFEGRGANVRSAANGNTNTNDDWYAVCYMGGVGDPFTEDGKDGFRGAFRWLRSEGNAGPLLNGHRDHKPTSCPGDEIYRWVHSDPDIEEDDMAREDIEYLKDGIDDIKKMLGPDRPIRTKLVRTNQRLGRANQRLRRAIQLLHEQNDTVAALAELHEAERETAPEE